MAALSISVFAGGKSGSALPGGARKYSLPEGIGAEDYRPGRIVFKINPSNSRIGKSIQGFSEVLDRSLKAIGAMDVVQKFPNAEKPATELNERGQKLVDLTTIFECRFDPNIPITDAINALLAEKEVVYAEPLIIHRMTYTPNDPNIGLQYHISIINCYNAWDIQKGDTNVVIAIVDSGTDWDHPDLNPNYKFNWADPINGSDDDADGFTDNFRGWDLVGANASNFTPDNDPTCLGNNHGSHVSGCSSAATDNGTAIAGPGFNCKFIGVKCSDDSGSNSIVAGYEGIVYSADFGAEIINCSWGAAGGGSFGQDIIDYATFNKDALVVAAAGNNGVQTEFFPAAYKNVLSVAATNSSDVKASFSNYGTWISVCAPGENIYATFYDNTYGYNSGTSMASPVAAGGAALVKSQFPSYNAEQVREQLRVTCDDIYSINSASLNYKLGKGRINLYNAVTVSSPAVVMQNYTITDGVNDIPEPNDTVDIVIDLKNFLSPTSNLTATLSTTNVTIVTVTQPTANFGVINTLATASNTTQAFRVHIKPTAPQDFLVTFRVDYTDGTYSDFEFITFAINPTYRTIDVNQLALTVNSRGNFAYNDFPNNTQGVGLIYYPNNLGSTILFEGGLLIGNDPNKVSDVVRNPNAQNTDFTLLNRINLVSPGNVSYEDGTCQFNDNGAGSNALPVKVNHLTYAYNTAPDDKYIIFRYDIFNNSTTALNNMYCGLYADWDIGTVTANQASGDASRKMGYVYDTDASANTYGGIKVLSAQNGHVYAVENSAVFGYTDPEKLTAMSSGFTNMTIGPNDVMHFVSAGPFSIPAGDSITLGFSIMAGDNLADLQATADAAQIKWDGIATGLEQVASLKSGINVYPNPASGKVNIRWKKPVSGEVKVSISDLAGRKVFEKVYSSVSGETSINVSGIATGVYFLQVNHEGENANYKLILE